MKKTTFLILLVLSATNLQAQTNLDSLYIVWEDNTQADSIRVNAYKTFIWDGYISKKPDSAFILAEELLVFAKTKQLPKIEALAYNFQGISLGYQGKYQQALTFYQRSLKIKEKIGDKKGISATLNNMGQIYENQGDYKQALEYHERSLKIKEEIGDKKGMANSFNRIGFHHENQGDYAKALEYYLLSQKIQEEIGDKRGITWTLINIGNINHNQGNYHKALDYFQRSLKIQEELGDNRGIANSLSGIGLVYTDQGNYPKALDYHLRSLKTREEIGDKIGISGSLTNIGNIYISQNEYPQALDYHLRSLKISEELGDKAGIASSLNNIGNVYYFQNDYSQALDYYQRSLKIGEEVGDKQGMANSLNNIGNVFYSQGEYIKGLEFYKRSLKIQEELGDTQGIAGTLNNIGSIYGNQGSYFEAIIECQKSLNISEEIGYLGHQKAACICLYDAYKDSGNSIKALEYHERLTILNDSLFNQANTKKLTQLAMQYQFDKQEALTEMEQEKKDLISAQELKQKKLERNGFMAGFGLVLLFAAVVFRQRNRIGKEKERSEELLMNILPKEVAEELKEKGHSDAQLIDQVTVLFTDFKGFTALSEQLSPNELVADLHACFSEFDRICENYGIEKIKTIGDAYMAAGGLPSPNKTHAQDVVKASLEMAEVIERTKAKKTAANQPFFEVRLGVHTGPVVAGIVGVKKFQYDIWGDTVNTASRMESSGVIGKVNISEATYEMLKDNSEFTFKNRGKIEAKGKGEMEMYFVERK